MNPTLLRRMLAATLFLAPLANAIEQSAPVPPEQTPKVADSSPAERPALKQVIQAGMREVEATTVKGDSMVANLERLRMFQHSAPTAAAFKELLGTERPWTLDRHDAVPDATVYRWRLNPARYTALDGTTYTWSVLSVDLSASSEGRQVSYRGAWQSFLSEHKTTRIAMRDVTFKGAHRAEADLWYSNVEGTVGTLQFGSKTMPSGLTMRHAWAKFRIEEHAGGLELAQSQGVKAIQFGGHRIDNLKLGYRVANIDKTALMALASAQKQAQEATYTPEEQLAMSAVMMQQMVSAALKSRTGLEVEMSGAYKGHRVQLRGEVSFQGEEEVDLNDKATLFKRINARVHVRLPVALVREAATAFVGLEAGRQPRKAKAQNLAKKGRDTADALVRQVLDEGYARVEKGVLVATVELRDGVLRVNGKEIPFPQPRKTSEREAALNFFDTRRKDEPCALPDYPAEVVEKDLPYSLELTFGIGLDGKANNGTAATASDYPEYDRALLEAATLCRYIPAMENGQSVEKIVTLHLKRVPGSARP